MIFEVAIQVEIFDPAYVKIHLQPQYPTSLVRHFCNLNYIVTINKCIVDVLDNFIVSRKIRNIVIKECAIFLAKYFGLATRCYEPNG